MWLTNTAKGKIEGWQIFHSANIPEAAGDGDGVGAGAVGIQDGRRDVVDGKMCTDRDRKKKTA